MPCRLRGDLVPPMEDLRPCQTLQRNRSISLLASLLPDSHSTLHERSAPLRSATAGRPECLAIQLIVVRKECLDLVEQRGPQTVQRLHVFMRPRMRCDRNQPMVLGPLTVPLPLFGLNYAHQPHR